jgi:hypothetical protein
MNTYIKFVDVEREGEGETLILLCLLLSNAANYMYGIANVFPTI